MSNLLATALGLAFTLFVCAYAAHALFSPWLLRMRRTSADASEQAGTGHPRSGSRIRALSHGLEHF